LRQYGKWEYKVKLDTMDEHPQVVESLVTDHLLDYVAVDLKSPRDDYGWVCENTHGFDRASQTINFLFKSGIPFEARTTLYPGLSEAGLLELASAVAPLPRYRLNLYRRPSSFSQSHSAP
jgi:pyruvate formate lyase activating enzyme